MSCGCNSNATPFAPVVPQIQCTGTSWLGFGVEEHITDFDLLEGYVELTTYPSTAASRFTLATTDLYISCSVEVSPHTSSGVSEPLFLTLSVHSESNGAGAKVLDQRAVDLYYQPNPDCLLTVQAFIPKGRYWSLTMTDTVNFGDEFIFFKAGAIS